MPCPFLMGTSTLELPGATTSTSNTRLPSFLLIGAGWFVSGYLLQCVISMNTGRLSAGRFCSSCDETLASVDAWLFGVPLAGWGLIYFAIVGLFLASGIQTGYRAASALAAGGIGVSIALVVKMLGSASPVCVVCLLTHAINLLLLGALWRLSKPGVKFKFALPVLGLIGLFAAAMLLPGGVNATTVLAAYESETRQDIPTDPADPVLGPANGRVTLVVFGSFQCPGCQWFGRVVHRLNWQFRDTLTITFKHFPLDRKCNPALSTDMQPQACAAAAAAEAANRQGAFWAYHDGLLASSLAASEPILQDIAHRSGVDMARWQVDRTSLEVRTKVRTDAALGMRLGVDGTPSVLLDGRRVKNISLPALAILIRHELTATR